METGAALKGGVLHDIAHMGVAASVGAIFIVHSIKKFDPAWQEWLVSIGIPAGLQLPIALAELVCGALLVAGVLSRLSSGILAVILLGAIFHVRWENGFLVSQGGWEWDLVMLAAVLLVAAAGPGRMSVARLLGRLPRWLH